MPHELMTVAVRPESDDTTPHVLIHRILVSIALTLLDGFAIWQWLSTDVFSFLNVIETVTSESLFLVMLGTLARVWSVTLGPVLRGTLQG
jgi:uncharacterized membrane protein